MKKKYFILKNDTVSFLKPVEGITMNTVFFYSVLFLFCINFSFGQIALRGTTSSTINGSTTLTINKPTGLAVGDIMIVQIMQRGILVIGDATSTGWTRIAVSNIRSATTNYSRAILLYKIATTTDVAAANFSFSVNGGSTEGAIIAFSGVNNSNPFDVAPGTVYTNISDDDTLNASSITTVTADSALLMFGAVHNDYNFSNWTTTNSGNLTQIYNLPFDATYDIGIGAAWTIKNAAGSSGAGSASISNDDYNGSILIALRKAPPTITSFGSNSGCVGGTITINGTNLAGATAANVRIGGTAVSSITSISETQIMAVIGAGTTGVVTVTNSAGTATSATSFNVNPQPSPSNAGPDQANANATSFTLAANTPAVGTGSWTIVSGPNTALGQFSSTTNPGATFTPATPGTYVLNWAISTPSCGSNSDQVVITNNCITNMITNGDFSNSANSATAANWTFATTYGDRLEVNPENTYFSNSNPSLTAELDSQASLRQVVSVIPGVTYNVAFRYSRRPNSNTPATTGVTVKITGGTSDIISTGFTTTSTAPQIGSFTFVPTSTSIGVEFYNTLHGNQTYGTIIDDIVLLPASQANPYAVTNPRGAFNTTTACAGVAVSLDVENATAGATYAWTGTAGAVFSSTNIKTPTITFSGSGLQQATVTVTSASGCAVTSTTYVNVTEAPVITGPLASAICSGSTYSSGAITSTGTTYDWSRAGVTGINNGAAATGGFNIAKATGFTETLTNSTNAPINVTYVLTPRWTTNSCAGIPYNLVVTVNPTVGITITAPTASFVCSGSGYSSGAITSTGTTFDWSRAGVTNINGGAAGSGGTNIAKATGFTETLTNSTNAPINVTYVLTPRSASGCLGTPYNLVITVNPLPSAPTAGVPSQPDCVTPTGSFTITNYNAANTYTFSPSTGVTRNGAIVTAPPGTYTITASNGTCSVASATSVVVNAVVVTTYNGTTWTSPPTLTKTGIIAAPTATLITISADTDLCSCTVNAGTNVSVSQKITLRLQDQLVVNGSLIFENNASLVQINDLAANSGSISYKRYTNLVKRYDFTYWSSPVKNQTLYNLSPNTLGDKYYSYNPSSGWAIHYNGAATMNVGQGYIVRAPQSFSTTTAAIDANPVFIGEPNNGVVTLSLIGNQPYLIGNPYPSAISADAFLTENASKLEGTLYFWTHNSPPSDAISGVGGAVIGDGFYDYTTNDYAAYNRSGGVSTASPAIVDSDPSDPNNNNNLSTPTGNIAAAQGFFAPSSAAGGDIVFRNNMRIVGGGASGTNNSQFFKLSTSAKENNTVAAIEKNRVWLNLTNKKGAFKQALIGYITGATNNYEGAFDGVTYDGNEYIDFYSVNKSINLSIQGRALPFEKKDSVALGYRSALKGEFQIAIDHTDGVLSSQNIFLEDTSLKKLHNLKKEPYTFNTEEGTFDSRFILRYVDKNAIEEVVPNPKDLNEAVVVSIQNGKITINSSLELIDRVIIYNVAGRKVYNKNKVAANLLLVDRLNSGRQVLVVDVLLTNNKKVSRKIIY